MKMNHENRNINGVNETQAPSEGVTPGRVSGEQQPAPGRYPATARTKWTKAVNKLVMKCYIMSNPGIRGYRKRMISKWKENGGFETTEQRLADQARAIEVNGWLTEMEIEEMKREVLVNTEGEDEDEALGLSGVTVERQTNADSGEQDAFDNRTENVTADVQTEQQRANIIEGLSDEEKGIYRRIVEVVNSQERKGLPSLQNANRKKLKEEVKKVNGELEKVDVEDITATNMLVYAGAVVVTERLGLDTGKRTQKREPLWKRRLESQKSKT